MEQHLRKREQAGISYRGEDAMNGVDCGIDALKSVGGQSLS